MRLAALRVMFSRFNADEMTQVVQRMGLHTNNSSPMHPWFRPVGTARPPAGPRTAARPGPRTSLAARRSMGLAMCLPDAHALLAVASGKVTDTSRATGAAATAELSTVLAAALIFAAGLASGVGLTIVVAVHRLQYADVVMRWCANYFPNASMVRKSIASSFHVEAV